MEILQPLLIARPELLIEFFFWGGCLWIGKVVEHFWVLPRNPELLKDVKLLGERLLRLLIFGIQGPLCVGRAFQTPLFEVRISAEFTSCSLLVQPILHKELVAKSASGRSTISREHFQVKGFGWGRGKAAVWLPFPLAKMPHSVTLVRFGWTAAQQPKAQMKRGNKHCYFICMYLLVKLWWLAMSMCELLYFCMLLFKKDMNFSFTRPAGSMFHSLSGGWMHQLDFYVAGGSGKRIETVPVMA